MKLTKHTVLQRAPDLTIELSAITDVELILEGDSFFGSQVTLAILDTFSTPKTIEQGLAELRPRIKGARAWLELTRHVTALYRWGVLHEPDQQQPFLHSGPDCFDSASVHIRMLNDRARTGSYRRAIQETVTPEDVVVDVGTGTGVLAVTAALAGARHVYAIEGSNTGRLAQRAFAANGLADRITLVPGRSTHVDLPEKADVLVSEIIGNDPLDEGILGTTADALKRFLKPDARLIPRNLQIYGLPVSIPANLFETHTFTDRAAKRWQTWYDMDFSALASATYRRNHTLFTSTYNTREWPCISEPVLLAELDLKSVDHRPVEADVEVQVKRSGELNGIIVFFETRLSESVHFSIHPSKATSDNSWDSKVWIAGTPVAYELGDTFNLTYTYGDRGSAFEINRDRKE